MTDLSYKDYFDASDVATYRRVKRGSMNLARVARQVIADMVGGQLTQLDDTKKEYLTTSIGRYRLANGHNSDNRTEMREHDRLHATVFVIGDEEEMAAFFEAHGYLSGKGAVELMRGAIKAELGQDE